ncbi:MAG: CBS domain-containing protein [Spirochaetia bacterium]|jgi:CBS domain-containing protein/anti-sigma regulatory factor (Ser/Thr protein kinase)|nr:CBS domain-containing protein [Spirochaetia bacterium]
MSEVSNATKIQELIYELKVNDACMNKLITTNPEIPMNALRIVFRDNRISGVPVLDRGNLVGIISLEDFIDWLYDGHKASLVRDRMSRKISILYSGEPLISAVQRFEKTGFGRFPVIDRTTGMLCGIITKGDIIECLLHKLEIDYREEEIHRYRASHLFEDIVGDRTSICFSSNVEEKNFDKAGYTSSSIKKTLRRLGVHPDIVRRASIASYEAEMNLVIYATNGVITVTVNSELIKITVKDSGPGMEDVTKAMKPGFSTAPNWVRELGFGAGIGLVNINNCADSMKISSTPGVGTTINLEFNWNLEKPAPFGEDFCESRI